jgi:hypothetical protein
MLRVDPDWKEAVDYYLQTHHPHAVWNWDHDNQDGFPRLIANKRIEDVASAIIWAKTH